MTRIIDWCARDPNNTFRMYVDEENVIRMMLSSEANDQTYYKRCAVSPEQIEQDQLGAIEATLAVNMWELEEHIARVNG